jgi:hypothetical protein
MKRWWSLFREAVRGSDRDCTVGPVGPALVMLSVPMVLEMAMESLFAVVDVFFVSRVSGDAVATVGVTESNRDHRRVLHARGRQRRHLP